MRERLGLVKHSCNPSTRENEVGDYGFKANLGSKSRPYPHLHSSKEQKEKGK
jgi:hypothetical protein